MAEHDWQIPKMHKIDGGVRKVGVEIEFTGLTLQEVTRISASWAGTEARMDTLAEGHISTRWGDLSTEIDWLYLKKAAEEQKIDRASPAWVTFLRGLAAIVVPTEVVCPPIPLDELWELESLIDNLRTAGAKGTSHSPLAAYGLHLNPELPDLEAVTIAAYLRAFGLLQWWLVDVCKVDLTRRITPYVDVYPEVYVVHTTTYNEHTTLEQLRHDFFIHNPTRNRGLDMWPLFAHFDASWVRAKLQDEHIKARPTLHYRLPNCDIDRSDWRLRDAWEPWRMVERLAADPDQLQTLSRIFVNEQRPFLGANRNQWVEFLKSWLKDHL